MLTTYRLTPLVLMLLLTSFGCRVEDGSGALRNPVPDAGQSSFDAGTTAEAPAPERTADDADAGEKALTRSEEVPLDAGPALIPQYGHCQRTEDCARGLRCCVRPTGVHRSSPDQPETKQCLTQGQCRLTPP